MSLLGKPTIWGNPSIYIYIDIYIYIKGSINLAVLGSINLAANESPFSAPRHWRVARTAHFFVSSRLTVGPAWDFLCFWRKKVQVGDQFNFWAMPKKHKCVPWSMKPAGWRGLAKEMPWGRVPKLQLTSFRGNPLCPVIRKSYWLISSALHSWYHI